MVYKVLIDKQKLIWDRDIYNHYWPKVTNIESRIQPMQSDDTGPGGYIFQHPIPLLDCNLITLHLVQSQRWIINIICHRWMKPIMKGLVSKDTVVPCDTGRVKNENLVSSKLAICQSSDISLTSWQMQVTLKTFAVFLRWFLRCYFEPLSTCLMPDQILQELKK